jgi:uncharacterized damage-inducible protein DinB
MNQVATTVLWEIEPLEDLTALRAYWQGAAAILLDYVKGLSRDDFEREVIPSWGKNPYKIKHILMHIVDHGANHRSEIGWHFTKLGHSVGDIGFMDYISQTRGI